MLKSFQGTYLKKNKRIFWEHLSQNQVDVHQTAGMWLFCAEEAVGGREKKQYLTEQLLLFPVKGSNMPLGALVFRNFLW